MPPELAQDQVAQYDQTQTLFRADLSTVRVEHGPAQAAQYEKTKTQNAA